MDLSNSDVPSALPLNRLCAAAVSELLLRRYTRRTVNCYKRVWDRLAKFACAQACSNQYSANLAKRFEQTFTIREGETLKKGER